MIKRILSVVFAAVMLCTLFLANPAAANAASEMSISEECVETIKKIEGFYAIPYWDYSQWTVGYGTTCAEEDLERYQTYGIPMDEANALMAEQLAKFEESVNAFAERNNITLTQGQFDALVSLTYNLGSALLYNSSNRVHRAVLDGASVNEVIFAFSVHCMAGGEFLPGLMRRRLAEANMFLNGVYDNYAPENYCYVIYDANGGTRDVSAQGYDCNLAAEPLSVPTYEGYTFVGWYTSATGGTRVTVLDEHTAGMTLYAHWEKTQNSADTSANIQVTVTEKAVNVRTGPGVSYSICSGAFEGQTLKITGITTVDGLRWGKFDGGWICLRYTNYADLTGDYGDPVEKPEDTVKIEVPIRATVVGSGAAVHNGPHGTYPQLKTLPAGTEIELTEIAVIFDTVWAKCNEGWVKVNLRILLHDNQKLAHSAKVNVTYYYLNIRSAPGASNSLVTSVQQGTELEILAVEYVGDVLWGRCSQGWVSLDYTSFDMSALNTYRYHSYGEWYQTQAGSCVVASHERRDCKLCGAYETRQSTPGSHSYGAWYESEPATCVTPGQERRDCANCDAFETRQTALGNHGFGEWYEVAAGSCTVLGVERRDCQYCSSYELRESSLSGHTFGEWIELMPSTCVSNGQEYRICSECSYLDSRQKELVDHVYGQWYETIVPTVDAAGEERRDCENCDAYETRRVEPTEHFYGEWYDVTVATCTEAGQQRRDCLHCDLFMTREIDALGHDMSAWYILIEPSCTEPGEQCRVCMVCAHTETEAVEPKGHDYDVWFDITVATCDQDGERCRFCKVCTYMDTETVTAVGHNYGNWITILQPTCGYQGEQCRICQICNQLQQEKIPALEHTYGEWYTVTPAACGKIGEERRDCSTCGYIESRELKADDHTFGQWFTVTPAACGTPGEECRVCNVCMYVETREVQADDHAYGAWSTGSEATCDTPGAMIRICANCGNAETKTIEAIGHNYGQWYVAKQPTTSADGEERRDCANCGKYESRKIDRLPSENPSVTISKVYAVVGDYYIHVRSAASDTAAAVDKLYYGQRVEVLEQKTVTGAVWVRFDTDRWICITDKVKLETVEEEAVYGERVFATVTVTLLNVRSAPTTSSVASGYLLKGERVEILEQMISGDVTWGRIAEGWICLTTNTTLDYEPVVTGSANNVTIRVMGTVTYDGLNVRSGCGASYSKVTSLKYGASVEILELALSGTQVWGRIEQGWVRVDGYVKLKMIRQDSLGGHYYGEWTVVTKPTCVKEGQERRNCTECNEYETRPIAALGHTYSSWTVGVQPTCVQEGMQARVCQVCMTAETQSLAKTDHVFGQWYVQVAATATQPGLESRDCKNCSKSEDRVIAPLGGMVTRVYGVVTGNSYVNVRAGSNMNASLLTTLAYGTRVEILEQATDSYGRNWGRVTENGWICLTGYVTLVTVTENADGSSSSANVVKNYGTVTASVVNIRGGVGATYDLLGVLNKGARVEILETKVASNGWTWGRISANGWICLTGYVQTETVTETVDNGAWNFTMKVNTSRCHIYSSTNTNSTSAGYYIFGAYVEILEQKVVNGEMWARTLQGWILGANLV